VRSFFFIINIELTFTRAFSRLLSHNSVAALLPHRIRRRGLYNSDAGVVFRYTNGRADNGARREAHAADAIKTTTSPSDVASRARRCAPLITEPCSHSLFTYIHPSPPPVPELLCNLTV